MNKHVRVPGELSDPGAEIGRLRGAIVVAVLDPLQSCWQGLLAEEVRNPFTIAMAKGLFIPIHVPQGILNAAA